MCPPLVIHLVNSYFLIYPDGTDVKPKMYKSLKWVDAYFKLKTNNGKKKLPITMRGFRYSPKKPEVLTLANNYVSGHVNVELN